MRRALAVAALGMAAAALTNAQPAAAAEVTKAQLDEVVEKLEANARRWLKNEEIDRAVEKSLASISFDKQSAALLGTLLRSPKRSTAHLYAVSRLLERLRGAKPEAVRAALPNVKSFHSRAKRSYRPIPRLSPAQAGSLALPPSCKGMNTEAIMTRLSVLEVRRDQKVQREGLVVKHNKLIGDIEVNTYRLLYLADDPKEDATIVRAAFQEERRGSLLFVTLLDELARNAPKMSPERARKICRVFPARVERLAMRPKKRYTNFANVVVSRIATSNFEAREEYAGIRILGTYNKIAQAAKSKQIKPVKVPTAQQIEEYYKKRSGAPRA